MGRRAINTRFCPQNTRIGRVNTRLGTGTRIPICVLHEYMFGACKYVYWPPNWNSHMRIGSIHKWCAPNTCWSQNSSKSRHCTFPILAACYLVLGRLESQKTEKKPARGRNHTCPQVCKASRGDGAARTIAASLGHPAQDQHTYWHVNTRIGATIHVLVQQYTY